MAAIFADDVSGTVELRVKDEANNITTISPHNFSFIPGGASEPMAWAFYSERGKAAINVDMMRMTRIVEQLSGERLIYGKGIDSFNPNPSVLKTRVEQLENENRDLKKAIELLEKRLDQIEANNE